MRLAVVGAGPAGLATLRALTARGFDAVAFERRPCVGGVWALHDDERPTAAYRSLHLITSRDRTEFAELPMPDGTPDYPSRDAVGRYLEGYAEKFGLLDRIRLNEGVAQRAAARTDGWELELESGERERFDMLVVANGHNEEAKWPDPPYPGDFDGRQLHALDYAEADEFRDQNVLVVGMGNSAMDIATDISLVADRTLPVRPPRHLGDPEAAARPARRPDHQAVGGRPRPVADPPAAVAVPAAADRRPARALRPARAEPRPLPGPPDDHRHGPQPDQPRRAHAEARHRHARAGVGRRSPTAARSPWTRSSGARATACRCRSSTTR